MAIFSSLGAWVTIGLGNLGLSLTAAVAVGGAVTNIAIGAALLGAQSLFSAVTSGPRSSTSTPQAQATVNQSTGPRIRGYGRAKLGGTRAFWDSKNGILYQLIMGHHGKIDGYETFYVGDTNAFLGEGGVAINEPLAGRVYIEGFNGDEDQVASSSMMASWPAIWTSDHRLRGIAYWRVEFHSPPSEQFQGVFPEGYNTPVRVIARLSQVYDPRTEVTAWSDNAALCILDYLTHQDGYNRSIDDIDIQSFADFADVCDEPVPLSTGGTEPRYRIWGVYSLTDDPQEVLGKMRAACDAEFYQTAEGKIAIRGGAWTPPTVTIRDRDIIGHSMEQGNNRFSAFNELKILYTSATHDYQTMEASAWSNLDDQEERGVLSASLSLDMVPSAQQARRLAKIHIAKANPEWKGTVVANLSALNALGERTVRLVLPELGIDDAFFVAGFSIRPDLTGVELSIMSINEASYTWTIEEEGQAAPVPEDTSPDLSYPVPTITSLTESDDIITVTVADPGRPDLELHAQIRAGAGSLWQDMQPDGLTAEFGPVSPPSPVTYLVRTRWRGALNAAGDWSTVAEIELG